MIKFENVVFGYGEEKNALNYVSFHISKGEQVGKISKRHVVVGADACIDPLQGYRYASFDYLTIIHRFISFSKR